MTTAAQQAQINSLQSEIRGLGQQISDLRPAEEAARIKTAAAQAALEAFQATPGPDITDLIEARAAAAANPNNAQLQQQLRITQESWDARQSQYLPLLRARDEAFEQEVARRRPIVALESRQVDLEVEIVRIDPAQASPEVVQYAKEIGAFPVTNVDPAAAAIPQITATTIPPQPTRITTAPPDDPNAGEAQARAFLAQRTGPPQTAAPVNPNPWAGVNAEKAAAWAQLSPADQRWLGDADPTDEFILRRAPNGGTPISAINAVRDTAPAPLPDDNLAFEPLPDDNLAFTQGTNPGPGYTTTFDEFGNEIPVRPVLPDDNLAFTQGVIDTSGYSVEDTGGVPTQTLRNFTTVPPDDPEAGEFEARQRLLDQQPISAFAPAPVSDDNLAFEPQFDDDLAFRSAPTVPRDDPQAGEFEARQFQIAQELRSGAAQETGISPYGEQDDPPEFPTNINTTVDNTQGYGTTFDEFGNEIPALPDDNLAFTQGVDDTSGYNVSDDNLAFDSLPDDNLAFTQGVDDTSGYNVSDDNLAFDSLPDDNLAFTQGVDDTSGYNVSDDNLAFEPQSDDNLAFEQETAIDVAGLERARVQAVLEDQQRQADSGDWRFKIRLAPGARYLYRGEDGQGVRTGILAPLAVTDGVVFPYTPTVSTTYLAKYNEQELPHSNYKGYFYSGSSVGGIQVNSVFTAQDTEEANYVLAVIHFFRSVTKMFYGQGDSFRGAPPPLVFLQGFGAYQFSRHPCVITQFTYNLPAEVDYIRADVQPISGLNIQQGRQPGGVPPQSVPTDVFAGALGRLAAAGIPKGAINVPPPADTLGTQSPTYVPTKIEITIELLPMQTRQQVSQVFNMRDFASGALLRKGFW
jgi:hypothetical protein